MSLSLFHDDWMFQRTLNGPETPVALPHDAMIGESRSADAATGGHGGYFPGGSYRYSTRWTVPGDARQTTYALHFEGVQGDTRILVDGREVAHNRNGYREFTVALDGLTPGATALIEVLVDQTDVPTDRWYSGSGIYRPVWLEAVGAAHIARDGVAVVTTSTGADADVEVRLDVQGLGGSALARIEFAYEGETVVQADAVVQGNGRGEFRLTIPSGRYWSAETPNLYDVRIELVVGGEVADERHIRTGLRTVEVDSQHGLRINGSSVLLRGAAVHHDNGILGAATFASAEHRRARILKEAGYNAIRSAHNPLSRAFLDACDELGLYVMDELTDVWFGRKTAGDGSDRFVEEWRYDVDSMITKDRNRPSVIMYSIGNEIAEAATPRGVDLARQIHEYVVATDPTRPTTLAVNPLLAMMASRVDGRKKQAGSDQEAPERKPATSTAANLLTAKLGRLMVGASLLPAADRATRGAFEAVDVAGYNYAYASYPGARKRYPRRVILGTESMPGDLPAIWKRVTTVPGTIGDFNWTGWDYLGEVGLGYWSYGTDPGGISKPYPGVLAGAGIFDITGIPGALLFLAQAVWGVTSTPGIAVRPLNHAGKRANKTPWLSTDAVPSWSWKGLAGIAEVEVYSGADQVELFVNGRSIGRKRAGKTRGYVARFRTPYEPGELTAVAHTNGVESGRATLRSADSVTLHLRVEEPQRDDDLVFVWVELGDGDGVVDYAASDRVDLTIDGPAEIVGFGSARPASDESFIGSTHATHKGRALVAIRRTGDGDIALIARGRRHGEDRIALPASALAGLGRTERT